MLQCVVISVSLEDVCKRLLCPDMLRRCCEVRSGKSSDDGAQQSRQGRAPHTAGAQGRQHSHAQQ